MDDKKIEVVEKYLSRRYICQNPVECNIEDTLSKLNFSYDDLIGCCGLFHRPDLFHKHSHEFVAVHNWAYPNRVYPTKEFLVKGSCSDFDVLKRDIETMEGILNENWLVGKVREKSLGSLGLAFTPSVLYLTSIGGISVQRMPSDSKLIDKTLEYLNTLTKVGGNGIKSSILVGGSIILVLGGLAGMGYAYHSINKRYASKLSDEAEGYNYGKEAENLLSRELFFGKVKSGEITKQDFSEYFGKT